MAKEQEDVIHILFNSSYSVGEQKLRGKVTFQTHKGILYTKGNDKSKHEFTQLLAIFLKLKETRTELFEFFKEDLNNAEFGIYVEKWMIQEGYALTYKNTINTMNMAQDQLYFFKPDK